MMVMATAPEACNNDGIRRLALTEQKLPAGEFLALHVRGDLREIDLLAEFRLQPALEAMRRSGADLVIHQQHVLAPLDRLVAAGEHLVRPLAAEKVRPLEACPHDVAQAREAECDALLLAIVAQLDQAQHSRGVEAGNGAEVEHHVADGFLPLRLDGALDALEQSV